MPLIVWNIGLGLWGLFEYICRVVRKVEAEISRDLSLDKEYLPIDGLAELKLVN